MSGSSKKARPVRQNTGFFGGEDSSKNLLVKYRQLEDIRQRRVLRHKRDLEKVNHDDRGPALFGNHGGGSSSTSTFGSTSGSTLRIDEKLASDLRRKEAANKKGQSTHVRQLLLYPSTLAGVLEEDNTRSELPRIIQNDSVVGHSKYPMLLICAVCGQTSKYMCDKCGQTYCQISCRDIHDEERCEKRGA